jgi:hypothetical protein
MATDRDTKSKQVKYIAKTKYTEPKSTPGGEFAYKDTGKDYKGTYFEDYRKKYFAGATPDDKGGELIKVRTELPGQLLTPAAAILAQAIRSFFKPKVKKSDKNKGTITRHFVQANNTKKITEVSREDYLAIKKEIPNKNFATVYWIIAGPAEDQNFNGYPYEGAASKNKKSNTSIRTSDTRNISFYNRLFIPCRRSSHKSKTITINFYRSRKRSAYKIRKRSKSKF